MKVSVLGAGNGGYALAVELTQMGHEVILYESEKFRDAIQPVIDAGHVINALEKHNGGTAVIHGVTKIHKATTDIKEAIEFCEVAMLIMPSFGQATIFEMAFPYINEKHTFVSLPGNFAFLDFVKIIQKNSKMDICKKLPFTMVEGSSIPYVVRKTQGNEVFISGVKDVMYAGVYPSCRTEATMELIKPLFSLKLVAQKNVIQTGLSNLNFMIHPPILLLNSGWVEARKGDFYFYREAASHSVMKFVDALDKERVAVGTALGFDMLDILTTWKNLYGDTKSTTLDEFLANAEFFKTVKAPPTLQNRFITEDLNYILAPMVRYLAKKNNVPTPVADAIITAANVITGLSVEPARNFDDFPLDLSEI